MATGHASADAATAGMTAGLGAGMAAASIAIMAKAPLPGYAKTRLIPAIGAIAAARLQRELTLRAIATASAAQLGPVVLWCAPDVDQRFFRALRRRGELSCQLSCELSYPPGSQLSRPPICRPQPDGDLGARMAHAFAADGADNPPLLLIGTDCPALSANHLRQAAQALTDVDAVFIPAEDGGYALIGLRRLNLALFAGVNWGTKDVMSQTREKLVASGMRWRELITLWDVDRPVDVARWRALQQMEIHGGAACELSDEVGQSDTSDEAEKPLQSRLGFIDPT